MRNKRLKVVTVTVVASLTLVVIFAMSHSLEAARQEVDTADVLFAKNCGACHGKDGRAKTLKARFNHARNLANPKWQDAISDEHMYEVIRRGKDKMPAFNTKLSKAEVAALVTYIRMLKKYESHVPRQP